MAEFDPKQWLRENSAVPSPEFDPKEFLASPTAPPPAPADAIPTERRQYTAAEVPMAAARNLPGSAKQFGEGLVQAVMNPIATLGAVADLGAGALRLSLPDPVVKFFDDIDSNPQAAQRATEAARRMGGMYADRYGSWEGIKRTVAEDPVGAAADLSTLLSGGAMATARAPAVSAALTQAANVTNPLTAVTAPARAGMAAVRQVVPSPLTAMQQRNLPRDTALIRGQAEGYMVPPGNITPSSNRAIIAERIAGKQPLEQLMSVRNQETTNRLARRAVGLPPDTPLTRDAMRTVRTQEAARGYQPVRQIGNITTDPQYLNDLISIEQRFSGAANSFPAAVPDTVRTLVNQHLVNNFDSADALQRVQGLRDAASARFAAGEADIGRAQRALANALEEQIQRGIQASGLPNAAELMNNFRASRQRMAISHSIEDAIREGTGNVNASKLANDIQRGRFLNGDLETIGLFASNFPRVSQTPSQIGTPASGTVLGLTGAITNSLSQGMRGYLMSQRGQRAAQPNYTPIPERLISEEATRNALLLQQAEDLRRERNRLMQ